MNNIHVKRCSSFVVVNFFSKSFILKKNKADTNYNSLIHRLLLNHNLIKYITEEDIDILEVKSTQCSTIEILLGEKISGMEHQSSVKEFVYVLNNKSKEINLKEYFLVPKFLKLPDDTMG
ncbi:hypothetical protein KU513_14410, partial (plasmid) [Staphylococcus aureus]